VTTVKEAASRLVEQVGHIVVGKRAATEQLLAAILVEGHVLLDDVPGVGKTTLARAVARSFALTFSRIQCTPDLVPSDITGVSIFDQRTQKFEYRPGPLMANIVLVDEINRATPRAQSSLLDVAPTILAWSGLAPLPNQQGASLLAPLGERHSDPPDAHLRTR